MCATFTEDEIGKTVVNANGESVGMIAAVEDNTARVDPDPGLTDSIKATLGWSDASGDTYPLQESAVASVTDDEVHLAGDLAGRGGSGTTAEASASETGGRTDRDDVGRREGAQEPEREQEGERERDMGTGGTSGTSEDVEIGDRGAEMAGTDAGETGTDERETGTGTEMGTETDLERESEPGTESDLEESGTEPGAGVREHDRSSEMGAESKSDSGLDSQTEPESTTDFGDEDHGDIPGPTGEMDREPEVEPIDENENQSQSQSQSESERGDTPVDEGRPRSELESEPDEEVGRGAEVDPKEVTDDESEMRPDEDLGDGSAADPALEDSSESTADQERKGDRDTDADEDDEML